MKNKKPLMILLFILFFINLIPATSVGTDDLSYGKVVYTPPTITISGNGTTFINGTEDTDTNATTECNNGEYLDGNANCYNFNDSVKNLFTEEYIIYNATFINTTVGTLDSGNLSSITQLADGDTYNVSEVTGAPGFLIYINFSGVLNFNTVALRGMYEGGAGHTIALEIFRVGVGWEERAEITDQNDWGVTTFPVFIGSNFIDGGVVQFRINHDDNGISNHNYFLDAVFIGQSPGLVSGGDLADLTGRENACALLPDVFCKDGSKNMTGNLNSGGYNFTTENLFIGSEEGDHYIYFYEGGSPTGRHIRWDDSSDYFYISDTIQVSGNIHGGTLSASTGIWTSADIHTTGTGDDFWLGSNAQLTSKFKAYADGSLNISNGSFYVDTEGNLYLKNITGDYYCDGGGCFNLTLQNPLWTSTQNETYDTCVNNASYLRTDNATYDTHLNSDGSDHSFINQGVKTTDNPAFNSTTITSGAYDIKIIGEGSFDSVFTLNMGGGATRKLTLGGDVYADQNLAQASSPTFVSPTFSSFTIDLSVQDYLLTDRSDLYPAWQGQSSNTQSSFEYFNKDGDGSDNINFIVWARGTPASVTNREFLQVGYITGTPSYMQILSGCGGTGVCQNLSIFTTGNTDQLMLETGGKVFMAQAVDDALGNLRDTKWDSATGQIGYDSSSIRYKENVEDMSNEVSNKVFDLRPVTYDKIDGEKDLIGLTAEEVDELFPQCVFYKREAVMGECIDDIDPNNIFSYECIKSYRLEINKTTGKKIPEGINYDCLISPLIQEVQNLKQENELIKGCIINSKDFLEVQECVK